MLLQLFKVMMPALIAVGLHAPDRARVWTGADARQGSEPAASAVAIISRADYAGDLAQLARAYSSFPVDDSEPHRGARLRYWKGFAAWRRAINGLNDSLGASALSPDVERAIAEFTRALTLDPGFVDAKVALISCYQLLTFLNRHDTKRVQELVPKFLVLLKEALAAAPENPRLLWVVGQSEWYTPPSATVDEIDRRQSAAIATYTWGLALARQASPSSTSLDPGWGEPELLMNLAWASLNRRTPDIDAAEGYANEALQLVPAWRYVRDILLHQIRDAKRRLPK